MADESQQRSPTWFVPYVRKIVRAEYSLSTRPASAATGASQPRQQSPAASAARSAAPKPKSRKG